MFQLNKRFKIFSVIILLLLSIPFIAMQFTKEVNWSVFDFVIAGILLFATAFGCELVLQNVKTLKGRILICGGILLALALIWIELAVGIFGSPIAGN